MPTQVRDQMSQVRGIADLGIFPVLGQPNLNIKVDRAKAARYGLNSGDVNTVIQAAMGGAAATTVLEGDRQFDLVVRYAPEYRDSIEKIRNIKVGYQTSSGANAYIPLSELATITLDTGASWIYHESTQRFIPVKFSVRGRDLGSTVAEAQAAHREKCQTAQRLSHGLGRRVWRPAGGQGAPGDHRADQPGADHRAALQPVQFACCDCVLTLAGIPFAIAGGVLALYVSGLNFSISAAIGFVSLFGVSVMNGILLITYYNQARVRGSGAGGRDVPRRIHPDAAPADDAPFRLHRPVSRGDFHRHRQPGAAPAGHRHRGRHVGRPHHAASRCAGAENDISRPR